MHAADGQTRDPTAHYWGREMALANHGTTARLLLTGSVQWHKRRAVPARLCALLKGQQDFWGALCFPPIGSQSLGASVLRGTERHAILSMSDACRDNCDALG